MKNILSFSCCLALSSGMGASEEDFLQEQFAKCLERCYEVDEKLAGEIGDKVGAFLQNPEHSSLLQMFIEKSEELRRRQGDVSANEVSFPFHKVLFESDVFRISWAETKSGEEELPQRHPWTTLMLVVKPSRFYTVLENGSNYEDDWPVGVYLLEPSFGLMTCKNIGPEDYQGLIVEAKK